jgi:hypothetical protein
MAFSVPSAATSDVQFRIAGHGERLNGTCNNGLCALVCVCSRTRHGRLIFHNIETGGPTCAGFSTCHDLSCEQKEYCSWDVMLQDTHERSIHSNNVPGSVTNMPFCASTVIVTLTMIRQVTFRHATTRSPLDWGPGPGRHFESINSMHALTMLSMQSKRQYI